MGLNLRKMDSGYGAFTLYEILVTIAIVAIVAVLAVPQVQKASLKSKISMERANITLIQEAKEAYASDNPGTPLSSAQDLLPYLPDNQMPQSPFGTEYENVTDLSAPVVSGSPDVLADDSSRNFVSLAKASASGYDPLLSGSGSSGIVALSLSSPTPTVTFEITPTPETITPTPTPVINNNPSVLLSVNPLEAFRNQPVTLTVHAIDVDGDSLSYQFGASGFSYGVQPQGTLTLEFLSLGVQPVSVLVTDGKGGSGVAQSTVSILNRLPTVTLSNSLAQTYRNNPIEFRAYGFDGDNDSLSYQFQVNDEEPLTQTTNSVLKQGFSSLGKQKVTVSANDGFGGLASTNVEVNITNRPPEVTLNPSSSNLGARGETLTFTANGYDADNDALEYSFNGGVYTGSNSFTASYSSLGSQSVTVRARDAMGAVSPLATTTVSIANRNPSVSLSANPSSFAAGSSSVFTAVGSDPDGDVLTYRFKVDSGSWTGLSSNRTFTTNFPAAGNPSVTVEAHDGKGGVSTASTSVWSKLKVTVNVSVRVADIGTFGTGINLGLNVNGVDRGSVSALAAYNNTTVPIIGNATGVFSTYNTTMGQVNIVDWVHDKNLGEIYYSALTHHSKSPGLANFKFDLLEGDVWSLNTTAFGTYTYNTLVTDNQVNGFNDLQTGGGVIGGGRAGIKESYSGNFTGVVGSPSLGSSYGSSSGVMDQTADRAAYVSSKGGNSANTTYNLMSGPGFSQTINQSSDLWIYLSAIASPLLIDLDQSGSPDLLASGDWRAGHSPSPSVTSYRDFSMDGRSIEKWEWVGPKDGLLVWTKDLQDTPTGQNLFGNHTWGKEWANGFEPLGGLDKNKDGYLKGVELENLGVWQDRNGDAKAQEQEIITAGDIIDSIAVGGFGPKGAEMISKGVLLRGGKSVDVWDLWPRSSPLSKMEKVAKLEWNNQAPEVLDLQRDFIPTSGGFIEIYKALGQYYVHITAPALDQVFPASMDGRNLVWSMTSSDGELSVQHRLLKVGNSLAGLTVLSNGSKTSWSASLLSGDLPKELDFKGSSLTIDLVSSR